MKEKAKKLLLKKPSSHTGHKSQHVIKLQLPSRKIVPKTAPRKKEGTGDPPFDLEQQFILRLPPGPAMALMRDVQAGSVTLKDKLSIELQQDQRHGIVRYGTDVFNAKLMDLPCIVESLKTVDMKTVYKTADICQMLVCSTDMEDTSQDENESPKKKEKDKKFLSIHGITPPLKNVYKRRFRKTLRKKYMEQPDIEKEVKRLFRMDAEAMDVKWEVVTEEEKQIDASGQVTSEASGSAGLSGQLPHTDTVTSLDLAIFGELSSSEEEDEDKEVNIMDSGEEDISMSQPMSQAQSSVSLENLVMDSQDPDMDNDLDTIELQNKVQELSDQLQELREKRQSEEDQVATMDDPTLKQQLQSILENTIQEEAEREKEYEILLSMLNQG